MAGPAAFDEDSFHLRALVNPSQPNTRSVFSIGPSKYAREISGFTASVPLAVPSLT